MTARDLRALRDIEMRTPRTSRGRAHTTSAGRPRVPLLCTTRPGELAPCSHPGAIGDPPAPGFRRRRDRHRSAVAVRRERSSFLASLDSLTPSSAPPGPHRAGATVSHYPWTRWSTQHLRSVRNRVPWLPGSSKDSARSWPVSHRDSIVAWGQIGRKHNARSLRRNTQHDRDALLRRTRRPAPGHRSGACQGLVMLGIIVSRGAHHAIGVSDFGLDETGKI